MPRKDYDFKIIEGEVTTTVAFYSSCASFSPVWEVVALGLKSFILLSASVFIYQYRAVIEILDESSWLAFLVYSHSVFLIIRAVAVILAASGAMKASMLIKIMGIVVQYNQKRKRRQNIYHWDYNPRWWHSKSYQEESRCHLKKDLSRF